MADVQDAFTNLLGQQAKDADREELYRVRDALGVKPTDAVWLLFIALQYYKKLYETIPAQIARSAENATKSARSAAEAQAKAAQEETKKALLKAVEEAVASRKDGARAAVLGAAAWLGGGVVLGALIVFVVGFRLGATKGEAVASARTKDECGYLAAAASWTNTPEGQLAYELAKVGSVRDLATCSRRGWEIKAGQCIVRAVRGSIYGWALPPLSKLRFD